MWQIKRVRTRDRVLVDSVSKDNWEANRGGINEIHGTTNGVRIYTTFNSTFVPWSNILFVQD
jgi:hypothetical protein